MQKFLKSLYTESHEKKIMKQKDYKITLHIFQCGCCLYQNALSCDYGEGKGQSGKQVVGAGSVNPVLLFAALLSCLQQTLALPAPSPSGVLQFIPVYTLYTLFHPAPALLGCCCISHSQLNLQRCDSCTNIKDQFLAGMGINEYNFSLLETLGNN